MKTLFSILAMATLTMGQAQITQVGTNTNRLLAVHSLSTGTKLLATPAPGIPYTTMILYNPDMTIYRSLVLPPPPPGSSYYSYPTYFTETLFDTDPTTVEFIISIVDSTYAPGCMVIREDGTVLFTSLTEFPGYYAGTNS